MPLSSVPFCSSHLLLSEASFRIGLQGEIQRFISQIHLPFPNHANVRCVHYQSAHLGDTVLHIKTAHAAVDVGVVGGLARWIQDLKNSARRITPGVIRMSLFNRGMTDIFASRRLILTLSGLDAQGAFCNRMSSMTNEGLKPSLRSFILARTRR